MKYINAAKIKTKQTETNKTKTNLRNKTKKH